MESDDHQVSAAPERTEMESDDYKVWAAPERTEMESDDHQVSAAAERTEMDVQLVCNDLCLTNMGKQLNAQHSTSFKLCKYHKRLMEIAQLLAEEASDMLELQSLGVSSSKNLEFADCLRSSGHEFSDINNHLLWCAKSIKLNHLKINNLPTSSVALQADTSPSSNEPNHEQNVSNSKPAKKGRSHKCLLCNQKFPRKVLLMRHFDNIHTVVKYQCSKCSKTFSTRSTFHSHVMAHKNGMYKCNECDKCFNLHASCFNHMKGHHVQSYKCQLVTRDYQCKSELTFREHCNYYHLSKKTVPCPKCKKMFQMPTNLQSHKPKCKQVLLYLYIWYSVSMNIVQFKQGSLYLYLVLLFGLWLLIAQFIVVLFVLL